MMLYHNILARVSVLTEYAGIKHLYSNSAQKGKKINGEESLPKLTNFFAAGAAVAARNEKKKPYKEEVLSTAVSSNKEACGFSSQSKFPHETQTDLL